VTQARAQTATREEAIIFSEQAVRDAENALRRLIGEDIVLPEAAPLPIEPATIAEPAVQPAQDLKKAFQLRPDYQAARLGIDIRRANESLAKNQLLPQLDFVGSYGYSGLDPDFERSRRMVANQDNRAYSAGMVVNIPLTFTEGRGKVRSARLQRQQAEADLGRLEQDIAVSVAHAGDEIDTTHRRVEADRTAYQLAQQALENEIKKLRAGTSNTFFVLNLQENVAGAENSLYNALADQRRAAASYDHELGTTLAHYNVTLTKN
jgi:outer membrane protein TolC